MNGLSGPSLSGTYKINCEPSNRERSAQVAASAQVTAVVPYVNKEDLVKFLVENPIVSYYELCVPFPPPKTKWLSSRERCTRKHWHGNEWREARRQALPAGAELDTLLKTIVQP